MPEIRTCYLVACKKDEKQAAKVSRVDRDIPKSSSSHDLIQSDPI